MNMFLIQSAILIAVAFLVGCILGCVLRLLFSTKGTTVHGKTVAVAVAATTTAPTQPLMRSEREPELAAPAPEPAPVMATMPAAKPKPASKPKVAPKPKAAAAVKVAASAAKPDNLKLISGIGPVNERKLNALGINTFMQIAAWKPKDEVAFGEKLEFPGRIEREEWVRQAKNLASGGIPEDAAQSAGGSAKAPARKAAAPARTQMAAKLAKPVGGKPDNLTLINGIGNVIEKKLHAMGVFHFEQIANWTKVQAGDFSKAVGFPGRAERENWMKEAALLMKGGTTEHARKVEAGEIATSRKSTTAEKAGTKKK